MEKKLDKRRKYYLILDCETATLPFVSDYQDGAQKQKIAIAKPLIYDLGWIITDKRGNVYSRKNYLITEIFSVPEIFNTAYYASKRPLYIEKLSKKEIILTSWENAIQDLENDMQAVCAVGAYNSMFDFKKAIPFTDLYISQLYSNNFYQWLNFQKESCNKILTQKFSKNSSEFDSEIFRFRGKSYPLFDLWGLSCNHILNNSDYKKKCMENEWWTNSGKYFKTSAETTYRFLKNQKDFDEAHTALNDAEIEGEIFAAIMKKAKTLEIGIAFFPFKALGLVEDFV